MEDRRVAIFNENKIIENAREVMIRITEKN